MLDNDNCQKALEAIEEKRNQVYAIDRLIRDIESYCKEWEYEYELDEEGNRTWDMKKDENGSYIRHETDSYTNKLVAEVIAYLLKKL